VLVFHNGWEDLNMDVYVNTDPSTSDKKFGELSFAGVFGRTGYMLSFATHF